MGYHEHNEHLQSYNKIEVNQNICQRLNYFLGDVYKKNPKEFTSLTLPSTTGFKNTYSVETHLATYFSKGQLLAVENHTETYKKMKKIKPSVFQLKKADVYKFIPENSHIYYDFMWLDFYGGNDQLTLNLVESLFRYGSFKKTAIFAITHSIGNRIGKRPIPNYINELGGYRKIINQLISKHGHETIIECAGPRYQNKKGGEFMEALIFTFKQRRSK
jgi:hypothetical protein